MDSQTENDDRAVPPVALPNEDPAAYGERVRVWARSRPAAPRPSYDADGQPVSRAGIPRP